MASAVGNSHDGGGSLRCAAWGSAGALRLHAVSGMVAAMAVATVIGLVRARWTIPFLSPIDPQFGVENHGLHEWVAPMKFRGRSGSNPSYHRFQSHRRTGRRSRG